MSFQAELQILPTANTLQLEKKASGNHFRFYYADPVFSEEGTTLASVVMSPFHTFDHIEQTFNKEGRTFDGVSRAATVSEVLYFMQFADRALRGEYPVSPEINRMQLAEIVLHGYDSIQHKAAYLREQLDRDEQAASDLATFVTASLDL